MGLRRRCILVCKGARPTRRSWKLGCSECRRSARTSINVCGLFYPAIAFTLHHVLPSRRSKKRLAYNSKFMTSIQSTTRSFVNVTLCRPTLLKVTEGLRGQDLCCRRNCQTPYFATFPEKGVTCSSFCTKKRQILHLIQSGHPDLTREDLLPCRLVDHF